MTMGLQDLMMFRDNLQQPEMSGMDNLRNLQTLTMRSMADQNYANMAFGGLVDNMVDPNAAMRYAASGGIVSLPVVQAGFGGFLKKAGRFIARTPAGRIASAVVKPISKTKVGRIALQAAPLLLSGGNPALAAAIAAGIKIAQDPNMEGNPYKVLQSAGKAYAGAKLGQAMKGASPAAEGTSKYGGDAFTRSSYQPGSTVIGAPAPVADTASSSIFGDIGKSLTDTAYDPEGTVLSRLGERIAGTGQFEGVGLREQLGLPPSEAAAAEGTGIESARYSEYASANDPTNIVNQTYQPKPTSFYQEPTTFSKRLVESLPGSGTDKPGFLLGRELSNVPVLGKLVPESAAGQLAAGAGVLSGVASLQGQQG